MSVTMDCYSLLHSCATIVLLVHTSNVELPSLASDMTIISYLPTSTCGAISLKSHYACS